MTPPTDHSSSLPPDLPPLDRLVDGELSETQRRELLERLDHEPEGWRRCALAFLEAQSWRRELDDMLGDVLHGAADEARAVRPVDAPSSTTSAPPRRSRWLSGKPGTALAMAASFLVALTLGWTLQESMQGDAGGPAVPPAGQLAQGGAATAADALPGAAENGAAPSPAPAPGGSAPGSTPWETVTLVSDGDEARPIEVPARSRDRFDNGWLQSLPTPMPPDVREALERMGRRVRQHRELVPIEMEDGRRLIVPVDEVEVDTAGDPPL
jgi:anti-sigma factor RsiW